MRKNPARKIFLVVALLSVTLSGLSAYRQSAKPDRGGQEATHAPAPTTIDSLLEQARILRKSGRPTEARLFAEQSAALAEKQKAWEQLVAARQELSFED